tara:strand:- start:6118 stop:6486 length:369 start_codon:yes stop_codon:yes gene_type:complete
MEPLIIEIFEHIGYSLKTEQELFDLSIPVEKLKEPTLMVKLYSMIPNVKSKYKSTSLTCLHKNSMDKQKFPAINFIRQILKCNGYLFNGYYICNGYNKANGAKILSRFYNVKPLEIDEEESA